MKLFKSEKSEMLLEVPEFGTFDLKCQPGGTLKEMHSLGDGKSERVIMFYEKKPSLEHGKIHFKLERYADSGDLPCLDNLHVSFSYNRKDEKWHFDKWDGTIGRDIAPMQWEKMLSDFFTDKNTRKWLKDEETYGPPKKGIFQHFRMG